MTHTPIDGAPVGVPQYEQIKVLWAGKVREAYVVKRFKNGKVQVQITRGRWLGGRPGSSVPGERVTVEAWQVVTS
jgi:hypothetical protein